MTQHQFPPTLTLHQAAREALEALEAVKFPHPELTTRKRGVSRQEHEDNISMAIEEVEMHTRAIDNLRSALELPAQPASAGMVIVGHQYQWTNPGNTPDTRPGLTEWKTVEPRWHGTMQEKIEELLEYQYAGKPTYRVRALYTPTNIPQPEQPALQPLTDEQRKILAFLNGSAPLDGLWFGEIPIGQKRGFWWRKHLDAAFAAHIKAKD